MAPCNALTRVPCTVGPRVCTVLPRLWRGAPDVLAWCAPILLGRLAVLAPAAAGIRHAQYEFQTLVSNLNCLCTHPHRALRTTSGLHLYTHTSGLSIPSRLVLLSVRLQCCAVCFVRQLVGSPVSRRLCMMSCYYLKCTMSNPRQKTCAVCVVGWLWVPYLPHADYA